MSEPYTKLLHSILNSTVWLEPAGTRLTWVTMLAEADRNGCVYASKPGLADRAKVTREEVEIALRCFLSPDPDSRTQEYEGRRIEEIEGGWRLLNHGKIREMRSADERREYMKTYMADRRAAEKGTGEPARPAPPKKPSKAKPARGTRLPDDWEPSDDLLAWAVENHPQIQLAIEVPKFRDFWTAKAGAGGTKLDWDATFRNWIRNATPARANGAGPGRRTATENASIAAAREWAGDQPPSPPERKKP